MTPVVYPRIAATQGCDPQIQVASSANFSPALAAAEFHEGLGSHNETGLVLAFVSDRYDREALSQELRRQFGQTRSIGCTTAGEIGLNGYVEGSISGLFLPEEKFTYEIGLVERVSRLEARTGQSFAYQLRERLAERTPHFDPSRCFALLLIDGLCRHEENAARAFHDGLGGIPMVGGSAGDGLKFGETAVLYDGHFHTDSAVLLVAATPLPITTFKTQHFVASTRRVVLTGALPEKRIATEINGFPAAEEYARVIGVDATRLNPDVFSANPLVVKIGGTDFVRSIQKANADGTLTFFCAIDEGIVFNVARRLDFVDNLKALFEEIEQRIGRPQLVIGCDCILRRLELAENGGIEDVSTILREHRVIGFNSYGEQFRGIHVNQTFTGVAIGDGGTLHG